MSFPTERFLKKNDCICKLLSLEDVDKPGLGINISSPVCPRPSVAVRGCSHNRFDLIRSPHSDSINIRSLFIYLYLFLASVPHIKYTQRHIDVASNPVFHRQVGSVSIKTPGRKAIKAPLWSCFAPPLRWLLLITISMILF